MLGMVYKKSLVITLSNKKNGSTGAITNLMASDSDAVLEFMWYVIIILLMTKI